MRRQLAVGVELARRFQAHLIGLAVLPAALLLPAGADGTASAVVNEPYRAALREEAQRMKQAFDDASDGQGFTAEWVLDDGADSDICAATIGHAYPVDLIISGPVEAVDRAAPGSGITEQLVIGSGRPVLVMPKQPCSMPVGSRVLIGWNGSRESTKAVFDALPLLADAQHVKVLMIVDGNQRNGENSGSAEELCQTLARHDVRASAEAISLPGADIGPALISAVKAESADLLVMGCIGYTELYEFKLGAASRHVLHETPVPVLMSH